MFERQARPSFSADMTTTCLQAVAAWPVLEALKEWFEVDNVNASFLAIIPLFTALVIEEND